jgi:hypothetical protein
VNEARLAKMHLAVDDARQNVQPLQSIRWPARRRRALDLGDAAIADADIARPSPSWLTTTPFARTRSKIGGAAVPCASIGST